MAGYTHIWEFIVAPEHQTAFESLYGPTGAWVALFRTAPGYLGTSLLRDRASAGRYLTVDRWRSESAWQTFRADRAEEYEALDAQGEGLTLVEREIGQFTDLDVPTESDRSQDWPRQESHMSPEST